ncbi:MULTISPECIES: hypothetical protein [Enterobacter]|jgi:hypothetical protein|uniref:hypothetical protein n=1 Tax=Enterobacter TaxID=547 RepID=UPI0013582D93|nr:MULTISPECIES: hypothetical protein [Enterobacter]
MNTNPNLIKKIENGSQVGQRVSFLMDDEICWTSVGLQKWNGKYKVYIDEILESKMNSEEYQREEVIYFDLLDNALEFIENNTHVKVFDLIPCKGQRIFNPDFD